MRRIELTSWDPPLRRSWAVPRALLVYAALVVAPAAIALLLLRAGAGSRAGAGGTLGVPGPGGAPEAALPKLLLAVAVVIGAAHLAGGLLRSLLQPGVVGEIFAGILLGPSLLGLIWPEGYAWLFPGWLLPHLNSLAQLGLVFFMFLVGLELDLGSLKGRGHMLVVISHVSIAVPFLLGVLLALYLSGVLAPPPGIGLVPFALFLGASLSVTAFPVLSRILKDRDLLGSQVGVITLSCAAVDDVTAWCLLAVVVTMTRNGSMAGALLTVGLTAVFSVAMLLMRPMLRRLLAALAHAPRTAVFPLVLVGVLLSALITDGIGIHPIFGAFLFGLICPKELPSFGEVQEYMRHFVEAFMLPLFFAYTGLHTEVSLLGTDPRLWLICGLILVTAVAGKWLGCAVAARAVGVDWRRATQLGILMNCRGLTELVILNIGLELGVLDRTLFTMLVIMALASTVMTAPILDLLQPRAVALDQATGRSAG